MSKENIEKFYARLESDPALLEKIEGEQTEQALLRLARDEGFDFSDEELKAYLNDVKKKTRLSDNELAGVSGGMTDEAGCTIVTIGYGCEHWTATDATWWATAGHCGSCRWKKGATGGFPGQYLGYDICTYNCHLNGTYWYPNR
jgi:predicted ribosomally synthesized peptide with nif11-like leader